MIWRSGIRNLSGVVLVLNSYLQSYNYIQREAGDIESEWAMAFTVEVIDTSCGRKGVGECCGGNPQSW